MREALSKLEERLWSIVKRFLILAREDPARLVAAVRIVELQEMVDAQLAESGAGTASLWPMLSILPGRTFHTIHKVQQLRQEISSVV